MGRGDPRFRTSKAWVTSTAKTHLCSRFATRQNKMGLADISGVHIAVLQICHVFRIHLSEAGHHSSEKLLIRKRQEFPFVSDANREIAEFLSVLVCQRARNFEPEAA